MHTRMHTNAQRMCVFMHMVTCMHLDTRMCARTHGCVRTYTQLEGERVEKAELQQRVAKLELEHLGEELSQQLDTEHKEKNEALQQAYAHAAACMRTHANMCTRMFSTCVWTHVHMCTCTHTLCCYNDTTQTHKASCR